MQSNLATLLAGAEAAPLPLQVQTSLASYRTYTFAVGDGARLIAIWNDGSAVEEDAGVESNLTVPGLAGWKATAFDPLHSLVQPLVTRDEAGALLIEHLQVKDYGLLIRLAPMRRAYLPIAIR